MMWEGLEVPQLPGFSGFVPPDGNGTYKVMIMGEAPGEIEARFSRGFHEKAPAGSVLARLLRRAGLERDDFLVTNAVWSRPPGNRLEGADYEGTALAAFRPFLDRLFELHRPRVVLALGNTALRVATDFAYGGYKSTITHVQGYVLDSAWSGCYVIGALHPSAIMRGEQRMSGVLVWALQRAIALARSGFVRDTARYVVHPSLDDALAFERGYNPDRHILSYDIETAESSSLDEEEVEEKDEDISFTITRISLCFSGSDGYAISLPWQGPFIDVARRMLGSCGPKRVWNGNFDNPRLAAAKSPVAGRIYDSMWAWKFLQPTLPRSLGFVAPFYNWTGEPWKSTSEAEPEAYSCKDSHALQLIGDGVDEHLRQKGQWQVYERHMVDLGEVLTKMSENGLPYDTERAAAFEQELRAKWDERFAELQRVVPDELKPSKQKEGYKKEPKDTTGLTRRRFQVLGSGLTEDERAAFSDVQEGIVDFEIYDPTRWCKLEPFLPTSWQQLMQLIKHYGFKPGTNRKTKKETTEDDTLKKLVKRCRVSKKPRDQEFARVLQMCRECRQLSKVLGTYVKGWRPGRDGRIHATPGHWGHMMRISWRRPNISATIQDKNEEAIAQGFRKCVATSPGKLLLESDWRGIEGVLVGWFANDPDYMRLAKIGVHDYFCAHILASKGKISPNDIPSLSLSDEELKSIFRDIKKRFPKDRDDAKHCIAAGELVLTNHGLIPIESIRSNHLLWDGVEWVSHSGVVLQGEHEVITYEGLTATPDHEVVTQDGFIQTLGRTSSLLGRLEPTGSGGEAIRTGHSNLVRTAAEVRRDLLEMQMYRLWRHQVDQPQHVNQGTLERMQDLQQQQQASQISGRVREALRRYCRTLQRSKASILSSLWWSWYLMQIQITQGLCAVGIGEFATPDLSWDYFGQDQQQRSLRAGESKMGNSSGASSEYRGLVKTTRTYDILNAGPRRCFTVSGKLVLNCIHGQNYGMGPRLMSDLYEMTEVEARRLQTMYFELFPKIREWQRSVLDRASRECKLRNPWSYEFPFWEVFRWDSRGSKWTLGEDAKSAIAFLPRDTAAGMLKEVLLRLRPLADSGIMLASTHDSITCECDERDLDRIARLVKMEMERPVPELGGLSIGVEQKYGRAWHESEMETLELINEPV